MKDTMFPGRTFISFDLETTGLKAQTDRIIEIGAVKWQDGTVVDTWDMLINPGIKLPSMSEAITGITNEALIQAPKFTEIQESFKTFIGDAAIIGHNVQFDIDFLRSHGIDLAKHETFDTYELAVILLPEMPSYSLQTLTQTLGISQNVAHRAYHDAVSSLDLFVHLLTVVREIPTKVLKEIVRELQKTTWSGGALFHEALRVGAGKKPTRFTRARVSESMPDTPEAARWQWDPQAVQQAFAEKGSLAACVPGFQPRAAQQELAQRIAATLHQSRNLIAEAGTGTGKTFAYLLPVALRSVATNERAVVATYTIALQEQIREHDLATIQAVVKQITGSELRVEFLKGRSNYFCKNRFDLFRARDTLSPHEARLIIKVLLWLPRGRTFERSELPFAHGEEQLWSQICSDASFCKEPLCTNGIGCAIQAARERALASHVIVTNQALLASDMRYAQHVLPPHAVVVVDEAHHLVDVVSDAFTEELQSDRWEQICREIGQAVSRHAVHAGKKEQQLDMLRAVSQLIERGPIFFGLIGMCTQHLSQNASQGFRIDTLLDNSVRESSEWHKVDKAGSVLLEYLHDIQTYVGTGSDDTDSQCAVVRTHLDRAVYVLERVLTHSEEIVHSTVRLNDTVTLSVTPLRLDVLLRQYLYADTRSVILTSATLATEGSFAYMKRAQGIDDTWDEYIAPPVFDHRTQACIMVPTQFPNPMSPKYPAAIMNIVRDVVVALSGRTLVLVTSFREVERLYAELTVDLRGKKIDVLAQGLSGRRERLINTFKQSAHAVLIGTATFWEGIDVPGPNLSCVIIPKLPFEVPVDPVYQARSRQYEDGFKEYGIPRAIIALRQGVGRLIRTVTDRGVVVLLDTRLQEREYGASFLASLPPMEVLSLGREEIAASVKAYLDHP